MNLTITVEPTGEPPYPIGAFTHEQPAAASPPAAGPQHHQDDETEPCESCGHPVVLIDLLAEVCARAGVKPRADRRPPAWCEPHFRGLPDGSAVVQLREHIPELCRAVRAGTPIPVDWGADEEDEEDEENDEQRPETDSAGQTARPRRGLVPDLVLVDDIEPGCCDGAACTTPGCGSEADRG